MNQTELQNLLDENARRKARLACHANPETGLGCTGQRVQLAAPGAGQGFWVPTAMAQACQGRQFATRLEFERERICWDFEFWCWRCARIRDKQSGRIIPFALNGPQRRVLAEIERQRLAGGGIRLVLLKARQWGGSTLVLMYMAWIQLVLRQNWNSVICSHKRNNSRAIKGMYRTLLRRYPREMLPTPDQPFTFSNFEGSSEVQRIGQRNCLVILGSAFSEDAVRGYDVQMAHLSEVAFWPHTPQHAPEDLMRSIDGSVQLGPLTMVVMESTANGMGSFFHNEWLRAKAGVSDKTAVFVPWYEIELYQLPVGDVAALWRAMDDYERQLWTARGCTLEQINWYHHKRAAYDSQALMMAEFPTTDIEAFAYSGRCVFDRESLRRMQQHCRPPMFTGDIVGTPGQARGARLVANGTGLLRLWAMPQPTALRHRYVVSVDVGGRTDRADYSVISVLDRGELPDAVTEVVGQWRGHIDHDLLAWKAVWIAALYEQALLVFESNSLEHDTGGDVSLYLLNTVRQAYGQHLYVRRSGHVGFQTNRDTKARLVTHLVMLVRKGLYVERDQQAIDEFSWFEQRDDGKYGAVQGKHDDIVMSRGIGLFVILDLGRPKPKVRGEEVAGAHRQYSLPFAEPSGDKPDRRGLHTLARPLG